MYRIPPRSSTSVHAFAWVIRPITSAVSSMAPSIASLSPRCAYVSIAAPTIVRSGLVRATWLTDIHLNFLRPLALRAFYDRVREQQPNVLLVTGDIGEADSVARFVEELSAIAPIYFVLGNHDYY